ncbi:hypothetical protein F5884DRAFT_791121 [Xylogone sp. PMI_703]|nr:hypothetical protein F5884DRAFT_791121 [Xylogone sp. PMI_703]
MTSLSSQSSRRRSSPSEQAASTSAEQELQHGASSNFSASDDRDSVLLSNPSDNKSLVHGVSTGTSTDPPKDEREPRCCWICQQEDTDDTPETSEWRSPCPCSLQAHEACLIEWIASQESPRPGDLAPAVSIACPQCKAEIQVVRPRDYLVLTVDAIQRVVKAFVLPTALSAVAGCFYSGLLVYGVNTINLVFGREEARRILAPRAQEARLYALLRETAVGRFLATVIEPMDPFFPSFDTLANWKLYIGLPLIAPSLILSRTHSVDHVFAVLPISYLLFRTDTRDIRHWPPSPSFTIAALPYIRSAYNEMYKHAFGELEKKWDRAVQRRQGNEETEERGQQDVAGDVVQELERVENELFELQVEINARMDDFPNPPRQNGPVGNGQQPGDGQANVEGQNPQGEQPAQGWEVRRNISTSSIASSVMGALFLPAISSIMGDLLKLALPARFVVKQAGRGRLANSSGGLLQEKWGRSIIGGCLFVVLKDAIILYCKWKKARDFRKWNIVDYVKKNRK